MPAYQAARSVTESETGRVFRSAHRQRERQEYRKAKPEGSEYTLPILIGAGMIAAAILLSTLLTAVGSRFAGMESPSEESMWLIDRLTGQVYRCQAPDRGRAACEPETATGSLGGRSR